METESRHIRIALTGPASEQQPALVMGVEPLSPEDVEPYTFYVSLRPKQFDAIADTIAANVDLNDEAFISDEAGYYVEIRRGSSIRSGYLGSPSAARDLIDRVIAFIDAGQQGPVDDFLGTLRA